LHSQTLAGIEASELDTGLISNSGHFPAKSVNLFDQMAFCKPANRRVTAHGGDMIQVDRQKQSRVPHPGCGQRSLAPGMPCTHYYHIVLLVTCWHD
jgi:hypothetical protein